METIFSDSKMDIKPLVSVCMITYNQSLYIKQAIEGVLMQETDFPFEFIISDDCSTDSTRKICQYYKELYPDKITLLLPEKNLGISDNFTLPYLVLQENILHFVKVMIIGLIHINYRSKLPIWKLIPT